MENSNVIETNWENIVSSFSKTEIFKILLLKAKIDIKNYFRELKREAIEIAVKTKILLKKGLSIAKRSLKKVWKKINDKIPYTISIKITKKVVEQKIKINSRL